MTDHQPPSGNGEFPPEGLLERLRELLPDASLAAFLEGPPGDTRTWTRVNTLRTSVDTVLSELARCSIECTRSDWCREAIEIRASVRAVQELEAWKSGGLHIQSPSSIAASLVLAPRPGERVLDLCAAPGSKTSHLAALMDNRGELVANDASRTRSHRLRAVLELLGAKASVRVGRGERIGRREPEGYDRVLVDAPCSGEGMMRGPLPETWASWKPKTPLRLSSRQKSLLHSAIEATRPGGTIVYSTCTFAPEENELVVERALAVYEGRVALEPPGVELPGRLPPCESFRGRPIPRREELVRLAPPGMDGFFIAKLRRTG